MPNIPVFLINGFLDSGKTTFIKKTFARDGFSKRGKTLYILCEEGEEDFTEEELKLYNVEMVTLENEDEFNEDHLTDIYKLYKPKRIVIEMNFLWDQQLISYPSFYQINQIITLIDGLTFPIYFKNMRQQFVDVIKASDVVAFTKLHDDRSSLAQYKTTLRVINSQCLYCLINEDCLSTMEAFEKELPYDLNQEEIEIKDEDFGIFYIDTFDNRPAYEDKIITFNAWVIRSDKLEKDEFIAGRKVLTCCANDIQLYGYLVRGTLNQDIPDDSWIKIKAKAKIEYNDQYDEEEVVLYPLEITKIPEIKDPILDLR